MKTFIKIEITSGTSVNPNVGELHLTDIQEVSSFGQKPIEVIGDDGKTYIFWYGVYAKQEVIFEVNDTKYDPKPIRSGRRADVVKAPFCYPAKCISAKQGRGGNIDGGWRSSYKKLI